MTAARAGSGYPALSPTVPMFDAETEAELDRAAMS